ncbi:hypothetical protein M422DRAFT_270392 [Sphaerobolus stellatus SS14]|uniref:Uncharacterized protein n=1 Tax=Sphaerobolus stellatus (strain SS14) TaxID=990650 RepID=A0A0C9UH95_SPHS4|nr:hypothetical protein M422DRAFT_270392 [Sphaerobolus stellatus SS14]
MSTGGSDTPVNSSTTKKRGRPRLYNTASELKEVKKEGKNGDASPEIVQETAEDVSPIQQDGPSPCQMTGQELTALLASLPPSSLPLESPVPQAELKKIDNLLQGFTQFDAQMSDLCQAISRLGGHMPIQLFGYERAHAFILNYGHSHLGALDEHMKEIQDDLNKGEDLKDEIRSLEAVTRGMRGSRSVMAQKRHQWAYCALDQIMEVLSEEERMLMWKDGGEYQWSRDPHDISISPTYPECLVVTITSETRPTYPPEKCSHQPEPAPTHPANSRYQLTKTDECPVPKKICGLPQLPKALWFGPIISIGSSTYAQQPGLPSQPGCVALTHFLPSTSKAAAQDTTVSQVFDFMDEYNHEEDDEDWGMNQEALAAAKEESKAEPQFSRKQHH